MKIKRILSAIVAISAIATTPGLVGAVKPQKGYLGRKRERAQESFSEGEESESLEEEEEGYSEYGSEKDEEAEQAKLDAEYISKLECEGLKVPEGFGEYEYSEEFYENACKVKKAPEYKRSEFNALKNFVEKSSRGGFKEEIDGKNFADLVIKFGGLKSQTSSKYLLDHSPKIVRILVDSVDGKHYAAGKDMKKSFANAIEILAYRRRINQDAESEVPKVMDLLIKFADDPELRECAFAAIVALANSSDLLKNYFNDNKSNVMDLLFKSAGDQSLKKYIATIVSILVSKDFLKAYFKDNEEKIMKLMLEISNDKEAIRYVAMAFDSLISKCLLKESFKNHSSEMIDVLTRCANEGNVDVVAKIFLNLSAKNFIKGLSESEFSKMKQLIVGWQANQSTSKFAADVIACFASKGLFSKDKGQNETESEADRMIEMFFHCDPEAVSENIGLIASLDLLPKHLTYQRFSSILLTRWSLSADRGSAKDIYSVASNMKELFKVKLKLFKSHSDINKVCEIMDLCAESQSERCKMCVLDCIVNLGKNSNLSLVTNKGFEKLRRILKKCDVKDEEGKELLEKARAAVEKAKKDQFVG